jgi:hypothetical protein
MKADEPQCPSSRADINVNQQPTKNSIPTIQCQWITKDSPSQMVFAPKQFANNELQNKIPEF